ncbi:MAG: class I SAM-dependent rRNA methyltransferase [Nannocystaceae bacterium]|nr:class I SAM-dependent rRNA methyltransferase [Nannocystaceae bacterium]
MAARTTRVILRKNLRRTIAAGHPWIFRDALAPFDAAPGSVVTVVDARGAFVARGWSETGPIAVRVLTTQDEPVDEALLQRRLDAAVALRARVIEPDTDAYRLLHGEGDRVPGVVCDRYGAWASVQLDGEAAQSWQPRLLALLRPTLESQGVRGVLVRSGRRGHKRVELAWGELPPVPLTVREPGLSLCGDLVAGQKTGLFLDHRVARRRVRELSAGLRVLDLYAYIGGFSAAAGLGGAASVDTVDVAAAAIELSAQTWAANGLPPQRRCGHASDVAALLSEFAAQRRRFDLVIADPPSFAPSEASKPAALQAYAQLFAGALALLEQGGLLLAASCSSHVRMPEFEAALGEGAGKARRVLQVLERWGAPPDHPRLLAFPEGDYLKVVLARACDDARVPRRPLAPRRAPDGMG